MPPIGRRKQDDGFLCEELTEGWSDCRVSEKLRIKRPGQAVFSLAPVFLHPLEGPIHTSMPIRFIQARILSS